MALFSIFRKEKTLLSQRLLLLGHKRAMSLCGTTQFGRLFCPLNSMPSHGWSFNVDQASFLLVFTFSLPLAGHSPGSVCSASTLQNSLQDRVCWLLFCRIGLLMVSRLPDRIQSFNFLLMIFRKFLKNAEKDVRKRENDGIQRQKAIRLEHNLRELWLAHCQIDVQIFVFLRLVVC